MPFDFTRLIFVGIAAYIFFGELVDVWTAVGGGIIVASAVYAAYRDKLETKLRTAMQDDIRR